MKIAFIFFTLAMFISTSTNAANTENGLINVQSSFDVNTTADRLENALTNKGMNIFARINHAEGAAKVGITIRPTQLIIFGNPKVGSPLMLCEQNVAIDLPQKALVTEDENGLVWLTYNDPNYLVSRHNITGCEMLVKNIGKALANFAAQATQP